MTHRIHMTLDAEYVPQWGEVEGVRELIQNWLDAGGKGKPFYNDGVLLMDNRNAESLGRDVLLIGRSTKADDDEQRGQFGEGLKLGALALIRKGLKVVVRTGTERWEASLDTHPEFARTVLAWDIETAPWTAGVVVEVHGLTDEQWSDIEGRFRWDVSVTVSEYLPDEPGRIYVKGILVCENADLSAGYNLASAKVDRDRCLVDGFDLEWHTSQLLAQALGRGEVTAEKVLKLAMAKSADTKYLSSHCWTREKALLTEAWTARYGEALPCPDEAWVNRLEHCGRRGVLAPVNLIACLSLPKVEDYYRSLLREGSPVESLTDEEQSVLDWARAQIPVVTNVLIVEFMEESMLGSYTPSTGVIRIARKVLADRVRTLSTLIHEAAHCLGEDNSAGVDFLWEHVARSWLSGWQELEVKR